LLLTTKILHDPVRLGSLWWNKCSKSTRYLRVILTKTKLCGNSHRVFCGFSYASDATPSEMDDYDGHLWRFVLSHLLCTLLYSHLERLQFFILLTLCTIGRTPWTKDQSIAEPLPTHRTAQTQNNCTKNSMSLVGIEPRIPELERAKAVHDFNRAVTLIVKSVF
jgi:hypothetical protein